MLITGAQTAAFAKICKVFLSFPYVLVDLVQPFLNPLKLLWMTEGGFTEYGVSEVKAWRRDTKNNNSFLSKKRHKPIRD